MNIFLDGWKRFDNWLHDPNSSFNRGSKVKPIKKSDSHPEWMMKRRKFNVNKESSSAKQT